MEKKAIVKINVKNFDMYNGPHIISEDAQYDEDFYDEEDDYNDIEENDELVKAFDDNGLEFVTQGSIARREGRLVLKYIETDASDMSNEVTTLSYDESDPSIITMERNGACRTVMVFEAGKRYTCVYKIGGMALELIVRTYDFENKLTDCGGTISLGYTLENGGSIISRVKMEVKVELVD